MKPLKSPLKVLSRKEKLKNPAKDSPNSSKYHLNHETSASALPFLWSRRFVFWVWHDWAYGHGVSMPILYPLSTSSFTELIFLTLLFIDVSVFSRFLGRNSWKYETPLYEWKADQRMLVWPFFSLLHLKSHNDAASSRKKFENVGGRETWRLVNEH